MTGVWMYQAGQTLQPIGMSSAAGQFFDSVRAVGAVPPQESSGEISGTSQAGNVTGAKEEAEKTGRTPKTECQTCKERKYMDQSDEGNVSFQSPTHIAPGQAAAKVMSHEQEHVRNAVAEGKQENKKLVSVSVALKTGVCPECGRIYIAGGTTRTRMLTYRNNPYDQARKSVEGTVLRGMNLNRTV